MARLSEAQIIRAREVPLTEALDRLGLWWKKQRDFRPRTNPATQLLLIEDQFEMTMTRQRFVLRRRGDRAVVAAGYGAIDLGQALTGEGLRQVVRKLVPAAAVDEAAAPGP